MSSMEESFFLITAKHTICEGLSSEAVQLLRPLVRSLHPAVPALGYAPRLTRPVRVGLVAGRPLSAPFLLALDGSRPG